MSTFRKRVFYGLIIGKLVSVSTIIILWLASGYSDEQAWDLISTLAPIFLTFFTAGITYYSTDRKKEENENTFQSPLRALTVLAMVGYPLFCVFFIIYYASLSGSEEAFAALKKWIGIAELLFATYLGLLIPKIFSDKK